MNKETKKERRARKFKEDEEKHQPNDFKTSVQTLENEVMVLLTRNLNRMHSQFIRWRTATCTDFKNKLTDFISVWILWLHYDIMAYEKLFEGVSIKKSQEKATKTPLKFIKTQDQFWSSVNPFENILPIIWPIRITRNARLQLISKSRFEKEAILRKVITLATGSINIIRIQGEMNSAVLKTGPCAKMAFFRTYISSGLFMIYCVELNKIPYISENSLIFYSLQQQLKIIGFTEKIIESESIVNKYLKFIEKHAEYYIEQSEILLKDLNYSAQLQMRKSGNNFFPIPTSKVYLTPEESEAIKFSPVTKTWVKASRSEITINFFGSSSVLIQKLATEEAGTNFVKFLTTIPNFRIKLTKEQNEAVSSGGNIVLLGRSGTGKTTCAVLRMFAAELIFRLSENKSSRKFGPEDVGKTSVLHSAFVTASPVLTNEVKRFYEKLKEHVKSELERKANKEKANELGVEEIEADQMKEVSEASGSDSEEHDESGPVSMNFVKDEEFPLFLTVRRLVFMIDGSLKRPFFSRDMNGNVLGAGNNFEWHNEYKGSLRISKDYKNHMKKAKKISSSSESESDEDEFDRTLEAEMRLRNFEEQREKKVKKRNFEVDFKIFKEKFWPKIKTKTHLSALVLWTEITAYIKGSVTAWMYPGYHLPKYVYSNQSHKKSLLSREEKIDIWDLFIEYERWKVSSNAYDFQDIVSYLLSQLKFYGYTGIPLHFMMVDEVQDLTPSTIALLIAVTKEKLVFSGDTAQTIAKGVGFRFCDIETLFHESELAKPSIHQLTKNFRTHNQILALANSVVALLETLFPQTIDKMVKETSDFEGPVPKIITSQDHLHLFSILFGFEKELPKSEMQFGCNQVIIVRNQESKMNLHPLLSHALCLTVFEAKGLEFDDVILYNFFTESEISNEKWKILSKIRKREDYVNFTEEELEMRVTKLKCISAVNQSYYSLLCTELKHLYVAITRPKRNLIIFDENPDSRRHIQDYWDYMGVVEFVDFSQDYKQEGVNIKSIAEKKGVEAWRIQGDRMMSHKFYDQAAKCFEISGDELMKSKALAFSKANLASIKISTVEAMMDENCIEKPTKKAKAELIKKKLEAESEFRSAADEVFRIAKLTESKSLLKQAAQCYASGKEFAKAAQIYESIGYRGQAAESYSSCEEYEKAADLFAEKGDYTRAIECYSLCQLWDKLVRCLYKFKDLIPSDERKKYVYKYIPVALESMMPKILPNEQSGYIKKIVEEQKDIIKEAEESEEDRDD